MSSKISQTPDYRKPKILRSELNNLCTAMRYLEILERGRTDEHPLRILMAEQIFVYDFNSCLRMFRYARVK